jgi:hypothetical protein
VKLQTLDDALASLVIWKKSAETSKEWLGREI